jgi:hypothetical protein
VIADIEIVEEPIERGHTLLEARLDVRPLPCGDDPRQKIHGERALDALALAVDGERDPLTPERRISAAPAAGEVLSAEPREAADESLVVRSGFAEAVEHLVEEPLGLVSVEQVTGHGWNLWQHRDDCQPDDTRFTTRSRTRKAGETLNASP